MILNGFIGQNAEMINENSFRTAGPEEFLVSAECGLHKLHKKAVTAARGGQGEMEERTLQKQF